VATSSKYASQGKGSVLVIAITAATTTRMMPTTIVRIDNRIVIVVAATKRRRINIAAAEFTAVGSGGDAVVWRWILLIFFQCFRRYTDIHTILLER
jgi:hypothetical protein